MGAPLPLRHEIGTVRQLEVPENPQVNAHGRRPHESHDNHLGVTSQLRARFDAVIEYSQSSVCLTYTASNLITRMTTIAGTQALVRRHCISEAHPANVWENSGSEQRQCP